MFQSRTKEPVRNFGFAVAGLLAFSVAALAVTIWVMIDLLNEQVIVAQLVELLPPESTESAVELAGELRWQFRLSILVVLNLLATAFAIVLLWRAYSLSQESLRDIKALAEDILSSVDQGVITTDLDGKITSINRRGLEIFTADGEIVGRSLDELASSLPLHQFRRDALAQGTARLTRDFRLTKEGRNHSQIRLRAFCDILKNYDEIEIGSIIQFRDVTERTLIEERMHRMERFLELGSLAVGLHHEIKNPLAALSLHIQLLEEDLEERGTFPEANQTLTIVRQEVARIGTVLESFRDFASLGHLQFVETNLFEIVSHQVQLVSPQAEQNEISIHLQSPKNKLSLIQIDSVKIEQVLLNLLMNAIEAMPNGGKLEVRVFEVRTGDLQNHVVEVQDTGKGIHDELISRIFDPYFTTKGDGTGMGLAICEKIVRQHEGSLEVSSTSAGALFTLTLPVQRTIPSQVGEEVV